MQKDKIEALLGFAVKANKLIYGLDNLELLKKKRYLYIQCHTLSENAKNKIKRLAQEKNVPILETKINLEDILHKINCKVVGLSDKQMSEAILQNINNNYQLYVVEVN